MKEANKIAKNTSSSKLAFAGVDLAMNKKWYRLCIVKKEKSENLYGADDLGVLIYGCWVLAK